MTHTDVFMVESVTGEYVARTRAQADALRRRTWLVFEGVDGDEATNTITYWYRRATEDDEY